MDEEYEVTSRNVLGKLHHKRECVGPSPRVARSVEGIVSEGGR